MAHQEPCASRLLGAENRLALRRTGRHSKPPNALKQGCCAGVHLLIVMQLTI